MCRQKCQRAHNCLHHLFKKYLHHIFRVPTAAEAASGGLLLKPHEINMRNAIALLRVGNLWHIMTAMQFHHSHDGLSHFLEAVKRSVNFNQLQRDHAPHVLVVRGVRILPTHLFIKGFSIALLAI